MSFNDRAMNSIGVQKQTHRAAFLVSVFLAALAVLPYLQARSYDFVNFDDQGYVTENSHVLQGLNFANVGWAFTTFTTGNWHPLTWLSHMLDVDLWGKEAGGHHLTSVLLHAGNTAFVVLRFASDDRQPLAVCLRRSSFRGASVTCGIRRLDRGTQGCAQHFVRFVRALGLSRLHPIRAARKNICSRLVSCS